MHKCDNFLSKKSSIRRESSTDVIVCLILAYESATSVALLSIELGHTYGDIPRLLKYCFLGSSNRFSICRFSV